jgi:hypothetical protein
MNRRNSVPVVFLIVILFFVEAVWHFAYTPDDSFIYFQYARNLSRHGEIAFNRGEPSYGFTGPGWMLLSSLTDAATGDVVSGTKILDMLLALAALPVFYAAARKITPDTGAALLALSAFAANAWLIRWAGSGMESSMVALVSCLIVLAVLTDRVTMTFVLIGLLVLLRPESVLLLPLAAWFYLFKGKTNVGGRKATIRGIATLVLVVLGWMLYAKLRTGSYLPNTSVKAGWSISFEGIKETAVDVLQTFFVTDGVLIFIFLIFAAIMRWKLKTPPVMERRRELWFLVAWVLTVIGFYILSSANVVSRYLLLLAPCLPLLCLMMYERYRRTFPQRVGRIVGTAVLVVLVHVAVNQSFYWLMVEPRVMNFQRGMEANLVRLGKWLGENTSDSSRVLVADIGAIGFYSGRPLDDAAGLISPAAIPILRNGVRPYEMIASGKYQQWSHPDYIIHAADIPDALRADSNLVPMFSTEFSDMRLDRHAPAYYTLYQVKHH